MPSCEHRIAERRKYAKRMVQVDTPEGRKDCTQYGDEYIKYCIDCQAEFGSNTHWGHIDCPH
jgi:hypothetical protein